MRDKKNETKYAILKSMLLYYKPLYLYVNLNVDCFRHF